MTLKKILSAAASIIKFFIFIFFTTNSNAETNYSKYYSKDLGTLSLMYHRFNEDKYPSTNIQIEIFKKQIGIIKKNNYEFYNPKKFDFEFDKPKLKKKILISIDDAFSSFYENAWPYLKENKIPFILFVSTEPIGKYGYMTWDQIKEIEKEDFVFIGNHSHSHDYLINYNFEKFKKAEAILGTSMKSVGEAMAIGRNFKESLQKALVSLETGLEGLDKINNLSKNEIVKKLGKNTPNKILLIAEAIRNKISPNKIYSKTKIDKWFIEQIKEIVDIENVLIKYGYP